MIKLASILVLLLSSQSIFIHHQSDESNNDFKILKISIISLSLQEIQKKHYKNQRQKYQIIDQFWTHRATDFASVIGAPKQVTVRNNKFSLNFLDKLKQKLHLKQNSALDVAAGTGRITKTVLSKRYKTIDFLEQNHHFVEKGKKNLEGIHVRHFYEIGVQNFRFMEKYDLIWIEVLLPNLSDKVAIKFLKKCKSSLNKNGIIIVRQNVSNFHKPLEYLITKKYTQIIRTRKQFQNLFKASNLKVIEEKVDDIYFDNVGMNYTIFALR